MGKNNASHHGRLRFEFKQLVRVRYLLNQDSCVVGGLSVLGAGVFVAPEGAMLCVIFAIAESGTTVFELSMTWCVKCETVAV